MNDKSSNLNLDAAVVVADARPLVRRGIELLLTESGLPVAAGVSSTREAQVAVSQTGATVLVAAAPLAADPAAPGVDSFDVPVVLYEAAGDETVAGAVELVAAHAAPEELVAAVRQARTGAGTPARGGAAARVSEVQRLSRREREVLELFAHGQTGAEIAEALYVSPETVRTHTRNALRKLSARTRAHAVAMVVRESR